MNDILEYDGTLCCNSCSQLKSNIGFYSVVDNLIYDHCFIYHQQIKVSCAFLFNSMTVQVARDILCPPEQCQLSLHLILRFVWVDLEG